MYSYTPIEHTADAGFVVCAGSRKELLEGVAAALFSLVMEPGQVSGTIVRELDISGQSFEDLVFNFLRELVFLLSVEGLVFTACQVTSMNDCRLLLRCRGGQAGKSAPQLDMEIKAVTYHGFAVEEKENGIWEARFIVDI